MYPDFVAIAKEEWHKEAARILDGIRKIEIEHENMYRKLLERLEAGEEHLNDKEEEWICEVCGYVYRGKKPVLYVLILKSTSQDLRPKYKCRYDYETLTIRIIVKVCHQLRIF